MADIESLLREKRVFKPEASFAKQANWGPTKLAELRRLAARSPERFWERMAKEHVSWFKPWKKALDWKPPIAKWFVAAQTNVSYNCIDRHLEGENAWRRNKAALIWEGEPGDSRVLTFGDLHREVCKFANVLKAQGVKKGDRVAIYLPMIPEIAIAMLACTRIGAPHTVVFGGFSADALRGRILDLGAKLVVTADGGWRRGRVVELKDAVDEAVAGAPCVERVVVVRRTCEPVPMKAGRDLWWHELMQEASVDCPPAKLDSEHPLFVLYTSGSTGKPKGILHTTGGYLVHVAATSHAIFDLKDTDTFWCTADVGWVTGHSYVLYGPLANGATTVMYEGAPNHPGLDRFWAIVEKYRVSILYTAPTAIRTFIRWGDEHPNGHDLSSLRLLGTVGEPINPEAWMWYHRVIGKKRCPIVDTWWQTETGGILIAPLPGAVPTKPGSCTLPFPGIEPAVLDAGGSLAKPGQGGFLTLQKPWPGMLRGIWGDPTRYREQYWSRYKNVYFTGDGARRDKDGYFWVMGRVDDVMNVSGHRIGTMEVESALVSHPDVAEAAVVGRPDDLTGTAIVAFVTPKTGAHANAALRESLRSHVTREIGALARPAEVRFTDALPKTRSGKIMRRLLRDVASGNETVQDTTTLEDLSVLARLRGTEDA